MYTNGRAPIRRPTNVVGQGYAVGETNMPAAEVSAPQGMSQLDRYKKKKGFKEEGYERGKSRTSDYNTGHRDVEYGTHYGKEEPYQTRVV